MRRQSLALTLAAALAALPSAAGAQARLVAGPDGFPVVDYVGVANWAFSPTPRPVTTPVVTPTVVGNATSADRQYASDFPLGMVGGAPVLVVLPNAVLPAGTLRSFQTWNQATPGGSPFPSAGNTFNAYVLRPTGTTSQYAVVLDSGTLTVPPLSGATSELATYPVAPFATQAGDVLAFFGQGVPIDIAPAGTDVLSYPAPAAPTAGSTITLGVDPGFPIYPQARDYAFAATVDVVTGTTTTFVGGVRKFVDTLPGLTAAGANNLGQYLPVAIPDAATYAGSDYYEIEVAEYEERMHSDLPPTRLRGYRQTNTTDPTVSQFHYLGPVIVAQKDRPVRVKFTNRLPTGASGSLFIPVDETVMGSGTGPKLADGTACDNTVTPNACARYPQNRATLHLHGGHQPWISDGTPHQWITPSGEITPYTKGVSVFDVPDMPAGGDGSQTFYWTNQQSARLMFYHDHAYGITRLNVYVGEAAGYVLQDPVEQELVARGVIPADTIPLVIQDKSFVDADVILSTDPTWRWGTGPLEQRAAGYGPGVAVPAPRTGDLWFPHVYPPNQNPYDLSGVNPFGRWHYGPWFWPPTTGITHPPVPNPYYDPNPASSTYAPFEPPEMPGLPHPSAPGEAFLDVAVVNGTAYPTVTVDPKSYRFRILNAANDRFWNLQLYVAADKASPTTELASAGAVLCDGVSPVPAASCTEVKMVPATASAIDTTRFPTWPADGRVGGVPDPTTQGPAFIQFATEGGFLPAPAVVRSQPVVFNVNPTTFNFGNVADHGLLLGPAERADVVLDFSAYAGKTLILYNDAPAPFPASDPRADYFTGAPDLTATGGAAPPLPGYGPNTRTIMQIVVRAGVPAAPFDVAALKAAFASTPGTSDGAFARAQPPVIVAQGDIAGRGTGLSPYDTAYGKSPGSQFPFSFPYWGISRIQDTGLAFSSVNGDLVGTLPLVNGQLTAAKPMEPKAIQDEMGEVYDPDYGRMSARLGLEIPGTNALNQNFVVETFVDAPTEIIHAVPLAVPANDVNDAQIWKITHNGVDTHPIHFHLFEVQLLNRVGWDGIIRLPDANELGWKDTIRVSPLEDTIVALRMVAPKLPFGVPDSVRPMSPATPLGSPAGFTGIDPFTGNALVPPPTNQIVNYAWEYVWHCHILAHEEMDMMRPVTVLVDRVAPAAPILAAASAGGGVDLTWTDATPAADPATSGNPANEVGFRIERATGVNGAFTAIGPALANTTTFTDPAADPATGYFEYRVVAYNAAGEVASNVVSMGTPPPAPVAPAGLRATIATTSRISLSWTDASTDETRFLVLRSTNGGAFTLIATVGRTAAQGTATGAAVAFVNGAGAFAPVAGNTYAFVVRAVNSFGSTAESNVATLEFRVPPVPTGLAGVAVAIPGNTAQDAATVGWTDPATFETGFQVQRSTAVTFRNPTTFAVGPDVTTLTQNVSRANDFSYRVRAVNGPFVSPWSSAVRVVTP